MKKYELKYTAGEEGVFRMSTVESPAVKSYLVMFDDEMKALEFQDDDKQIIYSVAMRPNMLIPRKDVHGEPAMVFYTEETADALLQNFFKNNNHNGATINHDKNVRTDMYIFEAWKVLDPEKDKAAVMGMDVKKGDIVMGQKVDNSEVWVKIKNKELTGFSIEAYLEPVLTENILEMTDEELNARIKKQIEMAAQLGTAYDVEDKKYHIDKLEAGGLVTDPEGKPIASVTFEIDGAKITTDENGVITEYVAKVENEGEGDANAEMLAKVETLEAENEGLKTENNDLKAKITELEGKATEMSAEVAAAKKVALEMAEEVNKGLKPNPKGATEKKYEEMSNKEKAQYNRGKL